jgi:polysaccharide export outer membrane protein
LLFPALVWAQEPAVSTGKLLSSGVMPGDLIEVRMYDFPDLGSAGVRVHIEPDGSAHLPYAGTLQLAGKSPEEIEREVTASLRAKGIVKDPSVTVDVVNAVNYNVNVLGEVREPKMVPLYAPAPVSFILGQVGGTTGLAAHHLTIVHPNDQPPTSVEYDPDAPTSALNTLINPGDILSVSRLGVYFVAGEVNRPGIFPLGGAVNIGQASALSGMGVAKNITLLQALAQAGGITAVAARSKMRILRTINGKREEILVDEVKLYKGEIADPVLQADDIIYVPSSYIRLQTNNLFSTVVTSLYASIQLNSLVNK